MPVKYDSSHFAIDTNQKDITVNVLLLLNTKRHFKQHGVVVPIDL